MILSYSGKTIRLPAYVEPSLRHLAETTDVAVREIPGELDDAGKLVLVRSLLREGFLTLNAGILGTARDETSDR